MDAGHFKDFVKSAVIRSVCDRGRIGGLVLTQTLSDGTPKIREPEMRQALVQEAEARKHVLYGIEIPTRLKYRFTSTPGNNSVAARHDFVVLREPRDDALRLNLLELKEGQPSVTCVAGVSDCRPIHKDFQKLMLEAADEGKCIVHILQVARIKSIRSVLSKYNVAAWQAVIHARPESRLTLIGDPLLDRAWFTLFILVVCHRDESARPFLFHQHLENFGAALQRAQNAEPLFREDCLVREPLDECIPLPLRQPSESPVGKALTPDEVDQQFIARGLLSRLPDPSLDVEDEDDQPIPVEGELVSETIIRERR